MTPEVARIASEAICRSLVEAGVALEYNTAIIQNHARGSVRVSWVRETHHGPPFLRRSFGTALEYMALLSRRDFSCLLTDGSLLQFSWEFVDGSMDTQRLCYYPCPVELLPLDDGDEGEDLGVLERVEFGLLECIEAIGQLEGTPPATHLRHLRLRTPVRFDYCQSTAGPGHPASHLTFQHEQCRVPVVGPISLARFVRLIFESFYGRPLPDIEGLPGLGSRDYRRTITNDEQREVHLHWASHGLIS